VAGSRPSDLRRYPLPVTRFGATDALQGRLPNAVRDSFETIRFTAFAECHYPTDLVWVLERPRVLTGAYPPE
jgi:hypothetical protein